jgi:hypothetical protein
MATLADLENLIGPPTKPAPSNDWGTIEADLGLRLPRDYKALMDRYATLEFDAFLGLYIPNPENSASMRQSILGMLDALGPPDDEELDVIDDNGQVLGEQFIAHYPEPGGIIPWGSTQNGDVCFWETSGDPESWVVGISEGESLWRHRGGLLDFLVKANLGTLKCPLLRNEGRLDRTVREYTKQDLEH